MEATENIKTEKRGGARPGSGRKKTNKKFVTKTIRLPMDVAAEAEEVGITDGKYNETFVDLLKKRVKVLQKRKNK